MSGSRNGRYSDALNVGEPVVCKEDLQRIGHCMEEMLETALPLKSCLSEFQLTANTSISVKIDSLPKITFSILVCKATYHLLLLKAEVVKVCKSNGQPFIFLGAVMSSHLIDKLCFPVNYYLETCKWQLLKLVSKYSLQLLKWAEFTLVSCETFLSL